MNQLYSTHASNGLEIVAVNQVSAQDDSDVAAFNSTYSVAYGTAKVPNGRHGYTSWSTYSTAYAIDRNGEILWQGMSSAITDTMVIGWLATSVTNNPPVFTSLPGSWVNESVQYSYQAICTDADLDSLTWSLTNAPSGMSVDANGLVTWTPTGAQLGAHNVTLQVNDGTITPDQDWVVTVYATGQGPSSGGDGGDDDGEGCVSAVPTSFAWIVLCVLIAVLYRRRRRVQC